MSHSEQILDRRLRAIADPTRRRILKVLKEKGACSIDKEVGLCATDIEERIPLIAAYNFPSYGGPLKSRFGRSQEDRPLDVVPAP